LRAKTGIWQPTLVPEGRYFRLFLSHTSAYKREVGLLSSALSAHGIAGFVAHDAISPTQEWLGVIVDALQQCEALAAYLTDDFHDSAWTDQEVGAAIGRDILVIALKVAVDPYGFTGRYQAFNAPAGTNPHELAAQIAATLRTHPRTKTAMAEAVVDRFVHSYSYDNARQNLERLRSLPSDVWTEDLRSEIQNAVRVNDQISNALFGSRSNPRKVADEALRLAGAR
jgi:TIR domain